MTLLLGAQCINPLSLLPACVGLYHVVGLSRCRIGWEGVFGVARTQSLSAVGRVSYTTELANTFDAYTFNSFSARRPGMYYVELCAGAQVFEPSIACSGVDCNRFHSNSVGSTCRVFDV